MGLAGAQDLVDDDAAESAVSFHRGGAQKTRHAPALAWKLRPCPVAIDTWGNILQNA
jgi:hypothetical protein